MALDDKMFVLLLIAAGAGIFLIPQLTPLLAGGIIIGGVYMAATKGYI